VTSCAKNIYNQGIITEINSTERNLSIYTIEFHCKKNILNDNPTFVYFVGSLGKYKIGDTLEFKKNLGIMKEQKVKNYLLNLFGLTFENSTIEIKKLPNLYFQFEIKTTVNEINGLKEIDVENLYYDKVKGIIFGRKQIII